MTYHDTRTDTVGVDRLRREHEVRAVFEQRVDIAEKLSDIVAQVLQKEDVLRIPVAGNDARMNTLEQAGQLPRRGATLGATDEALMGHDGHSVARRAAKRREDVVPDVGLILLL